MNRILEKALRRVDLSENEALALWERVPLCDLAGAADEVRREVVAEAARGVGYGVGSGHMGESCSANGLDYAGGPGVVTWQIDRNVNITNVCVSGCRFCNFHCRPSEHDRAITLTIDDYVPRVEETLAAGGDQLLLQGGLHPGLGIDFYEGLFGELKRRFPTVKLHALGAPEVAHIARISGLSIRRTLERLVCAGLDSLPGAGAEILVDEVRRAISPGKPSVGEWLEVMREAHRMDLPTSATMMYGHVETPRDIVRHLIALRDVQAGRPVGTRGFVAFIPWIFRSADTVLEREGVWVERDGARTHSGPVRTRFSPLEYLRVIALSRLVLNNITNIQASWLTVGIPTAQMALHGGANDLGSIMIEENVVSSAGARDRLDADGICAAIRGAGFEPRLRDQLYRPR